MRTLGPGSLASLLKILLDIAIVIMWGILGLTSLIMVLAMVAGLFRLTGLGPELPEPILQFLQLDLAVALPMAMAAFVAVTFIVDRLRRIMATLIAGDPFVPRNAGHLRAIAIAIIVYQLIRYGVNGVVALIFTVFGRPVETGVSIQPEFALNVGAWIAVLALFVLSEVFREGARLRDEQKLTI
jgi:hypothetical protein